MQVRTRRQRWMVPIVAIAATLAGVSHARQAEPPQGRRSPERAVPPVDRSASTAARATLADARRALARAERTAQNVARQHERELLSTDACRALQASVQEARNRYDALRRPVLEALRKDEEFARAERDRTSAREVIERMAETERADYLKVLPHAKAALEAGWRMSRAEVVALALDPAIEDARRVYGNLYHEYQRMVADARREAMNAEPVQIAREDVEANKTYVEEATRRLADALAAEAEAERKRDRIVAAVRAGRDPPPEPEPEGE